MTEKRIACHFLRADMTAGYGTEPPWAVGEARAIKGKLELCKHGYHSSPTLWDALEWAPGPVACLVEIPTRGTIHSTDGDSPKSVSRSRKLLAAVNVDSELRLFAADCAEHVLWIYEREYPGDNRPRQAIEAARAYARGEIEPAARAAARDAAWDAAWAAAGDAAWDAASAAGDAASAAGVAVSAAGDAVSAAGDAARTAERAWQREQFEARFGQIYD